MFVHEHCSLMTSVNDVPFNLYFLKPFEGVYTLKVHPERTLKKTVETIK